ncbi:MAG: hypothetical protein HY940_00320 [Gammaproteobacteria bacterium]|nr:hypothetical protein [Gammaproteobacteria bacterium]
METRLRLDMQSQPDDTTCGPTCLQAIYRYYGDEIRLDQVISEHVSLREGGTFAVFLACHALRRGYKATLYTYNLEVFDPSWFVPERQDLETKLTTQLEYKKESRLIKATQGYLEFLRLGGTLKYEDLTGSLIRKYLRRGIPILTGLSSTYLYQEPRETGVENGHDDLRGRPAGHFVVLCGYHKEERQVAIADPFLHNPLAKGRNIYDVGIDRVLCAILLGIVTHDANLLIIEPRK